MAAFCFRCYGSADQPVQRRFYHIDTRTDEGLSGVRLERRSISIIVSAAHSKWPRSCVEHGRRRTLSIFVEHAASAVGTLQAALRAGNESANRSLTGSACDVAGCSSWRYSAAFLSAAGLRPTAIDTGEAGAG